MCTGQESFLDLAALTGAFVRTPRDIGLIGFGLALQGAMDVVDRHPLTGGRIDPTRLRRGTWDLTMGAPEDGAAFMVPIRVRVRVRVRPEDGAAFMVPTVHRTAST